MRENIQKNIILVITLSLLVFNSITLISLLYGVNIFNHSQLTGNAFAPEFATISYCINPLAVFQPIKDQCGENITLHTNESFFCQITAAQRDTDILVYSSIFNTEPELLGIYIDGSINYTTTTTSWGNHSMTINVLEDGSSCGSSQHHSLSYDFSFIFNNTPPEYYMQLPNVTLKLNSYKYPFYLNDYFRDIDEHALSYSAIGYNIEAISITIDPLTSEVLIASAESCDNQQVTFIAEDPYGGEAYSYPPVFVNMICSQEDDDNDQGENEGGSGGGSPREYTYDCIEDWFCLKWSDCYPSDDEHSDYPDGYQKKYCYDKNACDPNNYETEMYKDCNYMSAPMCYPDWDCTEWTYCRRDGTQERTCIDLNDCSEEEQKLFGIPESFRYCIYAESCTDGLQNNNEFGIDCGGLCEPCTTIELPAVINDTSEITTWVVGILIFLMLILVLIYRIFRTQIKQLFSKIIWLIVKKSARQIYLLDKSKTKIHNYLKDYEKLLLLSEQNKELNESDYNSIESKLYILFRRVFAQIFDLDIESSKDDFSAKIIDLNTTDEFRKILFALLDRFINLESKGRKIIKNRLDDIILDFNALKFFILNISDTYDPKEFKSIFFEKLKINSDNEIMSEIITDLNDTYIMLQHKNVKEAKQKYINIIEKYETLDEKDKSIIYDLTSELFTFLKYISSHIE